MAIISTYKNHYDYYIGQFKHEPDVWKIIDKEPNTYILVEDKENEWLYSMWFENGYKVREVDFPVYNRKRS